MENLFGKSIKEVLEGKAVSTYVGTYASDIQGIVSYDAGLAGLCRKQPMNGNLNLVYSGSKSTSGELPAVDIVAEATASATSVTLAQYSAIPAKFPATVLVPSEYIEDVPGMETFVSEELRNSAMEIYDKYILRGAFSNNIGLKGIIVSTDSINTTATLSAITITDIHEMVDSIISELQPKCTFVIAPATWTQLKASFLDVDNVNSQLITDGVKKTLVGYPVKVSTSLIAANPIVFGDFSKYYIGVNRELTVEIDKSVGFLSDQTALKITMRLAGGPACSKKYINGSTFGAFAYMSA